MAKRQTERDIERETEKEKEREKEKQTCMKTGREMGGGGGVNGGPRTKGEEPGRIDLLKLPTYPISRTGLYSVWNCSASKTKLFIDAHLRSCQLFHTLKVYTAGSGYIFLL